MPVSVWTWTAQLTSAARLQHAAVQREARPVDARLLVEVVVHVDLAQVRRRHLGPQQLVLLHQELARLARHPHRAVVVDHVVPAVVRAQPIDGGEIDARLPFGVRHGPCEVAMASLAGLFMFDGGPPIAASLAQRTSRRYRVRADPGKWVPVSEKVMRH